MFTTWALCNWNSCTHKNAQHSFIDCCFYFTILLYLNQNIISCIKISCITRRTANNYSADGQVSTTDCNSVKPQISSIPSVSTPPGTDTWGGTLIKWNSQFTFPDFCNTWHSILNRAGEHPCEKTQDSQWMSLKQSQQEE